MGPLGWPEMVALFILALLLFGPKKLPELGRTIGKAMTEFRRASTELKATFDREMSSLEREGESIKELTSRYDPTEYGNDYTGDSSYYDGAYNSASYESTATEPSTVSASASQGAEGNGTAPESGSQPAVQPASPEPPAHTEAAQEAHEAAGKPGAAS